MSKNTESLAAQASSGSVAEARAAGARRLRGGQASAGLDLPMPAVLELQQAYLKESSALWNRSLQSPQSVSSDRRFAATEWSDSPASAWLAQMYLLNARTLSQMAAQLRGDAKTVARIRFAVQQWIDAAAPSNLLATNPEALEKAVETQGASLAQGMQHLLGDLRRGHVSQTDESVFEIGRNVATTPGAIVFENELFQLIEYRPLTERVFERPLLFVPPCINKYYILDLQPGNSLIRWTVEQGHRVFVVSWRNADDSLRTATWDDYVENAAIRAIGLVREITGSATINTLGFCVGGTLLATALAVLAARREKPAASVTLLTTFLDFSDTGVLDLFVDESMVRLREATLGPASPGGGNLLKGHELATTFSFLRPNDLVWNYVVGNYLKGETPPAFDLLYWNSDGTNLPGPMYCWYLRNTYLENKLVEPDALTVCGEKDRSSSHRRAGLRLCLARGPHRAVARRLSEHAGARGRSGQARRVDALRTRRLRPHRRGDQPAGQAQAQPLDRGERGLGRRRRGVARLGDRTARQLVDRLGGVAAIACRPARRGAEDLRQQRPSADRAGAGTLRQAKGRLISAGASGRPRVRRRLRFQ